MELNVVWDEHGERFEPWRDVLEVCKVLPSWEATLNVGWNSSYETWECTSSATENGSLCVALWSGGKYHTLNAPTLDCFEASVRRSHLECGHNRT